MNKEKIREIAEKQREAVDTLTSFIHPDDTFHYNAWLKIDTLVKELEKEVR